MVKVLSRQMRKLLRDNPKAARLLLQNMDGADVIDVRSDDGERWITFKKVVPSD